MSPPFAIDVLGHNPDQFQAILNAFREIQLNPPGVTQEAVLGVLEGATVDELIVGQAMAVASTVTGATPALSPANGPVQTWNAPADSAPTISWAAEMEAAQMFTLLVTRATASEPDWSGAEVTWASGAAPTLSQTLATALTFVRIGSTTHGFAPLNASAFATAAQGALAETAVQPDELDALMPADVSTLPALP